MSTIAELAADRTVEGVYAVARKQRRTTRKGAPYLALELVDPTGRIEGRIWNDVELLDGRFAEGDAVRVLGRVERFDDRLQLEIRSVEAADADPAGLAPRLRRDADELDGFLEFLAGELSHPGLAAVVQAFVGDRGDPRAPCGSCRRPRHTTPTRAACSSTPSASRRSSARRRSSTPGSAPTSSSRRRSCTTSAASASSAAARPSGPPTRAASSATSTSGSASSRSGRAASTPPFGPSCCTRSHPTTTATRRGPPRRPCSTTPTSSTRSLPPSPSSECGDRAGTGRECLVGSRRLLRRADVAETPCAHRARRLPGRGPCRRGHVGRRFQ